MSEERPERDDKPLNQALRGNGSYLPPDGPEKDTPKLLTRWQLVKMLFTSPAGGLLFSLLCRRWGLPFILALLVFGVGACGKAISMHKELRGTTMHIGKTMLDDLSPIKMVDGKLSWRPTEGKDGYDRTIEGWRVVAQPVTWDEFQRQPYDKRHFEGRGTLVLKDCVALLTGEKGREPVPGLRAEQLKILGKAWQLDEKSLSHEAMSSCMEGIALSVSCAFAFCNWMIYVGTSLFCVLVFGVSAGFFGRWGSSRLNGFIIGLNVCLPAALISMLWSWAAPASWEFSSLYYGSFIIYLVLAYLDSRHLHVRYTPADPEQDEKENQKPSDKE